MFVTFTIEEKVVVVEMSVVFFFFFYLPVVFMVFLCCVIAFVTTPPPHNASHSALSFLNITSPASCFPLPLPMHNFKNIIPLPILSYMHSSRPSPRLVSVIQMSTNPALGVTVFRAPFMPAPPLFGSLCFPLPLPFASTPKCSVFQFISLICLAWFG